MKIFLDCGYYVGKIEEIYRDAGILDNGWIIYAWEADPDVRFDREVERIGLPTHLEHKAVWTEDTTIPFKISNRDSASSVEGTTGNDGERIEVPAFDFSKFVSELPEAYIICSMDIEGSEFRVLRKMLDDNTIDKINLLDVEFHHRFMSDYIPGDAQKLIDEILSRGVGVRLKIPLW